jgi:hypothetical protein
VRRQQERDLSAVLPSLQRLTERNRQLYFLLQSVILSHKPESLVGLAEADVADAAQAAAATLETEAKGVIYEHRPTSAPAQRLAAALHAALAEARTQGATIYAGEAALVLRAIAQGADDTKKSANHEGPTAYQDLMRRLLQLPERHPLGGPSEGGGSIIIP